MAEHAPTREDSTEPHSVAAFDVAPELADLNDGSTRDEPVRDEAA